MAKKSMIARERKRAQKVAQFAEKRNALKKIIKDPSSTLEQIDEAVMKLQRMPRDSSSSRQVKR